MTGADGLVGALCDLFGMSTANAARWATATGHITEPPATGEEQ